MTDAAKENLLKAYEIQVSSPAVEARFRAILVCTLAAFIAAGLYLKKITPAPADIAERISRIRTQFLVQEKTVPAIKKIPVPDKPVRKTEKPIDLTEKPEMNRQEDDIQKARLDPKPVRRVYGLRKVYSTGLGSGGSLSDAVVGKLGNTLNKDIDTLTATKDDIKGTVVSVTTITSSPRYKKKVKPEYTPEMIANKIEGEIRVKVLVDIDGKVKKAQAQNDLGFGSAQRAVKACYEMEFEPALRGDEPVAVWIIIPIRFVLLG